MTKKVAARFEHIETTIEKLADIANTLAAAVAARYKSIEAHDRQIAALIDNMVEKNADSPN